MKKYLNANVLLFVLLVTIVLFFLFPFSFHLESYSGYEMPLSDNYRGFGFPFIWYTNNVGTSLNTFFNPICLIIDLLIYYAVIFLFTVGGLRLFKAEQLKFKGYKILFIVLLVLSVVALVATFIFTFLFASIDFTFEEAIYRTIRLHFVPPSYFI